MARNDQQRPILPSILDRLIDDAPELSREAPVSAQQFLRDLRSSVRRDLENLLNSRKRFVEADETRVELHASVYEYGIPDIAGTNLSSKRRRDEFLKRIEGELREHEPRFKSVRVVSAADSGSLQRILRFRIEALMHAEPAPEQVQFDSRVEPVTRAFQVKA
ncbi:MAG TPA: type VI secretion system baseplate subunit TssE [Planctomycetota bacterium]|nr:type VI secretion system baseplate subunit TssE [Planctomycetota bacterium]